jgi:demethylmenaquinone methyltransferase/2-methoxy-6-polyprenyl-1,4-benzoquinol methylase
VDLTSTGANSAEFTPASDNVFARISGRYDRLCDVFSLGAHRLWKAFMARRMADLPGHTILDLASGTGDIPLRLTRVLQNGDNRVIWLSDVCPEMLDIARRKLAGAISDERILIADAERLAAWSDDSVDMVSISFGMKICDRGRVLTEAFRVLRPGGYFLCLEAARIPFEPLHQVYLAYMRLCMPLIGSIASGGDRSAYDYLLRGVHEFPDQKTFAGEMTKVGYREIRISNLTLGVVALHQGRKPHEESLAAGLLTSDSPSKPAP